MQRSSLRGLADQCVGGVFEKIGVGVGEAGEFAACHGMGGEEERAGLIVMGKIFRSSVSDAEFGAAGVGDQSVRWGATGDFREQVDGDADGERDVDEVGIFESGRQGFGEGFVDAVMIGLIGIGSDSLDETADENAEFEGEGEMPSLEGSPPTENTSE